MTYGRGYEEPADGWPPPSDPEPSLYGRRRGSERADDDGFRAFEPVAPPPVPEPPYRPRRSAEPEEGGPLTDRYVPRPSGREGVTGTMWQSTGDINGRVPSRVPEPVEPMDRPTGRFSVPAPPSPSPRPYPTPAPPPHLAGGYTGGGLVPMEPMERVARPGAVPQQWHTPTDEPDLDLPDRRRARFGTYDREARHGQSEAVPPPRTTPWQTALGLLAVVVLVAVCAAGGYFMFSDRGPGSSASAGAGAPKPRDISNRRADATPLTEPELFPAPTVAAGYQVLKTQASTDCRTAAVGQPVQMLAVQDCSQVVRGALLSADHVYVLTVGLFNFGTQVNAEQASDSIKDSVGAQKGRFTGYDLGTPPTDVYARAATQLGWDVRGHYLAYCVVARADAQAIPAGDPTAHKIIDDLVEQYLIGAVLQARVSPSPLPSGK